MRVLAISGSLRRGSYNTALLRAAAELAPEGVEVEFYEGLDRLPPFNEDREQDPPAEVERLRRSIADADALLFSTPEYNGTLPGQIKHAVDWASRPFGEEAALWGKPAAVIGASITDYGAVWAQEQLRRALGLAGARVLDADLPVAHAERLIDAQGRLADEQTRARLSERLQALIEHARALTAV